MVNNFYCSKFMCLFAKVNFTKTHNYIEKMFEFWSPTLPMDHRERVGFG
jgi:hypothetical protein